MKTLFAGLFQLILLIYPGALSSLHAQQHMNVDSLKNLIATTQSSSIKFESLLALSDITTRTDQVKGLEILKQAHEVAVSMKDARSEVKCLIRMSILCYLMSDFSNDIEYSIQAIALSEKNNLKQELATAQYGLGRAYYEIGDKKKCSQYYFNSLKIYEEIDDKKGNCKVLSSIGILFAEQNDYIKANEYLRKALIIAIDLNDSEGITAILNNLANVFAGRKQYDSALKYYQDALSISKQIQNSNSIAANYVNIGKTFSKLNKPQEAITYMEKGLKIFEKTENKPYIAISRIKLGEIYLQTGKPEQAIHNADTALRIGNDENLKEIIYKSAKLLGEIYLQRKDTARAFKYLLIESQWKDSLALNEKEKNLSSLELQYHFYKKEQEQLAARQKRTILAFSVIGFLGLGIIIILLLLNQFRLKAKKTKLENLTLENELDFKKKELTLNVMSLMKQNEMISSISEKILKIEQDAVNDETKEALKRVGKEVQRSSDKETLKEFSLRFKEIHKDFYDALLMKYPELTPSDLRLCAFLRLNMTSKEISELTGQQLSTLENARYRLRQKLGISNSDVNLVTFLVQI